MEEQSGNYLALQLVAEPSDAVTTVELVGGTKGPVTLDSDMNIVILIKNTSQTIKVTSKKGTDTITKIYSLTNLVLESE